MNQAKDSGKTLWTAIVVGFVVCFSAGPQMSSADPTLGSCSYFGDASGGQNNNPQVDNRGYPDTCINTETDPSGAGCPKPGCMIVSGKVLAYDTYCMSCGGESCTCDDIGPITVNIQNGNCKWGTNDPSLPSQCYCEYSGSPYPYDFWTCDQ